MPVGTGCTGSETTSLHPCMCSKVLPGHPPWSAANLSAAALSFQNQELPLPFSTRELRTESTPAAGSAPDVKFYIHGVEKRA